MKITIELTPEVIYGIAYSEAVKHGYDKLSNCDNDFTEMYRVAFYDGFNYLLQSLECKKSVDVTKHSQLASFSEGNN